MAIGFGFMKKKLTVLTDGCACYNPTCMSMRTRKHLPFLSFTWS